MKGRKPKPTGWKILDGNPGKKKIKKNEPQFTPEVPRCPKCLPVDARREWRRVVKELQAANLLQRVDRAALVGYCVAWAKFLAATRKIEEHGYIDHTSNGNVIQSAWTSIQSKAMEQIIKFSAEFGFTPSARTRIDGIKEPKKSKFQEFMSKKNNGA